MNKVKDTERIVPVPPRQLGIHEDDGWTLIVGAYRGGSYCPVAERLEAGVAKRLAKLWNSGKASCLSFSLLRSKNDERGEEWDAGQLPPTFASTELAGEVGEACNEVKKLERHRVGIPGGKESTDGLAEELADTVICADLLASRYGIDLGEAIRKKFNKTSDKHGFSVKL